MTEPYNWFKLGIKVLGVMAEVYSKEAEKEIKSVPVDSVPILEKESKRTCCVCLDNDFSVMFEPCHHLIVCETCSKKIDKCPSCRKSIIKKVKIYLP